MCGALTASLTFLGANALLTSISRVGYQGSPERSMTTHVLVSRLSIVTAYIAFAFVGLIVLGMF